MNTTLRIAQYAGTGVAGLAISCTLAAPALAMRPPQPEPGNGQHQVVAPPRSGQHTDAIAADGFEWSTLGAGLAGGAAVTGLVVLASTQVRRQRGQAHPA